MEQKLIDNTPLALLFLPVIIAVISVIIDFNIVDFVYVVLVGILFLKYFIVTRKQN